MGPERYRMGDLLVDVGTGGVSCAERRLDLPPLSFALLVALLRRAPEVVRRQDLLGEVWPNALVCDEALSQRVRLLRESLDDGAGSARYVESVRGWGYRIAQPVERVGGLKPTVTSLAVLPFVNMSGAPADDYLCEGLAEETISALTAIPGLRVIARTSSFAIARMGLDVREIGARLGVDTILEGSVRRADQRVRVTVQLVFTHDGSHLWSERYDRELTDVLALEDEIAEAVATRLRVEVAGSARERPRPPIDAEAHHAFLEGRYHFARSTPEALARAQECFERAVARDPGFARAYDSLAELYWYYGFFGGAPPREAFARSTWYVLRAVELDDDLAETHALLAMLRKELDYNWDEVEREVNRALELNPESPLVRLRYAISALLPHGRLDEAVDVVDGVVHTDPLSLFVRWWMGVMAFLGRRFDRAVDEGRHMVSLDPNHFLGHWVLGVTLEETGAVADAIVELEKAHQLSGGIPFTLGFLAMAYGRSGRHGDARALLQRLEEAAAVGYVPPMCFAFCFVGLGEWDRALAAMEEAVEARDPLVMPVKSYPFLDPVRDDPRLRSIQRRMNLD